MKRFIVIVMVIVIVIVTVISNSNRNRNSNGHGISDSRIKAPRQPLGSLCGLSMTVRSLAMSPGILPVRAVRSRATQHF